MFDVVGVGANSIDYVYRLPAFPAPHGPSSKLRITHHAVSPGGQTTTALCTCVAMGLEATYIGATGNDDNGERLRDELINRGVDVGHTLEGRLEAAHLTRGQSPPQVRQADVALTAHQPFEEGGSAKVGELAAAIPLGTTRQLTVATMATAVLAGCISLGMGRG